MRQAYEVTGKLRDASTTAVQNLIDGWDLIEMLMKADPVKINREAFAASLVPPVPAIFSTPQEILGYFALFASNHGRLGASMLSQLEQTMPTNHVSSLDHLLTLDIWLGDLPTTFEALAGWIMRLL